VSRKSNFWLFGGGLGIFLVIAPDLWREFREPGQTAWNVALAAMMLALFAGGIFGQWYFSKHAVEVGEARFDTRNKDER
jgi:hypothetical protein